jgi:hypothetical protein
MPAQIEQIAWESSLERGKEVAAKQQRAVLIDFSAAPV